MEAYLLVPWMSRLFVLQLLKNSSMYFKITKCISAILKQPKKAARLTLEEDKIGKATGEESSMDHLKMLLVDC